MSSMKYPETPPDENFERVLAPDGSIVGELPAIEDDELLRWYNTFIRTRVTEEFALRLQRRGVISVAASSHGEEACGLGAAAALRDGDWLHPSYRQTSALLYWGTPIDRMMASLLGHAPEHLRAHLPLPAMQAPQIRTTPYPIMLGTNFPMAVGTALSDKLAGNGQVSLAFIGEGSTSEGDFHDGLGLAGVLQAPTIFFIQNNQWCISIPAGRQTAAKTFAQKAVAHGLPWRRVDGNDVFAVYAAVRDAVERARAGDGATVIEGVTYRMFDHNSADSAVRYREETEPERWVARDPLTRFEAYLLQTGLLTEAAKSKMYEAAEAEVREAIRRAQAIPPTPPQAIFLNHLHGDEGWTVSREKWELEEELHGRNPFSEDNLFPGQNAA